MSFTTDVTIRPFTVQFPDSELEALRARIETTRWPETETVADQSQGTPLATSKALGAVLGLGIRLAQGRGEAECSAAVHH